jgi:hypothetical protein
MRVSNEQVFGVPNTSFGVSGSASGFTLNYSVDGNTWGVWSEATKANEPLFVVNVPKFMKYKLVGNTEQVEVRW